MQNQRVESSIEVGWDYHSTKVDLYQQTYTYTNIEVSWDYREGFHSRDKSSFLFMFKALISNS